MNKHHEDQFGSCDTKNITIEEYRRAIREMLQQIHTIKQIQKAYCYLLVLLTK